MNDEFQPTRIRIGLLHERVLFRESLARLLASEPDFEVVIESSTAAQVLGLLNGSDIDVVLLNLGSEGGADFISASREAGYQGKFLVITSVIDAASAALALRRGASGIFLESNSSARLIQAIRLVASGEASVDQKLIQLLASRYPQFENQRVPSAGLTERQQLVLQGVVDGLSSRNIGDRLGTSESTIKSTLQQLFARVGVRTRGQLVRAALEGALRENGESAKH
jgi:two-component system nitrate/nitrite response regulator NarL